MGERESKSERIRQEVGKLLLVSDKLTQTALIRRVSKNLNYNINETSRPLRIFLKRGKGTLFEQDSARKWSVLWNNSLWICKIVGLHDYCVALARHLRGKTGRAIPVYEALSNSVKLAERIENGMKVDTGMYPYIGVWRLLPDWDKDIDWFTKTIIDPEVPSSDPNYVPYRLIREVVTELVLDLEILNELDLDLVREIITSAESLQLDSFDRMRGGFCDNIQKLRGFVAGKKMSGHSILNFRSGRKGFTFPSFSSFTRVIAMISFGRHSLLQKFLDL